MKERNNLYPVFLKTAKLHVLIIGGGNVAEEKLRFLTKSSPDARVTIVAPEFGEATKKLAQDFGVTLITDYYKPEYLDGKHIVIATTDKPGVNITVYEDCRRRDKLVNVADNPPYCDFYMGGIVTRGMLKWQFPPTANRPPLPNACVNSLKKCSLRISIRWYRTSMITGKP